MIGRAEDQRAENDAVVVVCGDARQLTTAEHFPFHIPGFKKRIIDAWFASAHELGVRHQHHRVDRESALLTEDKSKICACCGEVMDGRVRHETSPERDVHATLMWFAEKAWIMGCSFGYDIRGCLADVLHPRRCGGTGRRSKIRSGAAATEWTHYWR